MENLVLIGGGRLADNETINKHVVKLSKKTNPNILFVATACNDDAKKIKDFKEYFKGCQVSIFNGDFNKIDEADIIYIGGGNTTLLIKKLKENGSIPKLIDALEKKVVVGISAGAIFWFEKYLSDSEMINLGWGNINLKMKKGIGYFKIACCPHYDEDGRDVFIENVPDGMLGIALENNTALIIKNDSLYVIKEEKSKSIYCFLEKKVCEIKEENYEKIYNKIISNINGKTA